MSTKLNSGSEKPPKKRGILYVNPIRLLLIGRPVATENSEHSLLPKITALPVFASDAISSVAYATQEILLALGVAGAAALVNTEYISIAIALLLVIVAISYTQTIHAYPSGGGSYIVAKDNIGVNLGLVAAGALLIDYILTVATSIASGVQNLIPMVHSLRGHEVALCVGFVLILLYANLRGLKESGTLFAFPTYAFVLGCLALIFVGLFGERFGMKFHREQAENIPLIGTKAVGMGLILHAFARGCSAMTGTEAISNGVPAFKEPKADNASATLAWMALILGTLFIGISVLAIRLQIHYVDGSPAVIDQLNTIVFGRGTFFYYFLQISTVAILVLAANTSFADFPRLASILARDGFMPRQLANIGDKLTFSNGIAVLGVFSIALLVAFHGNTDKLVPLYAIGVFIAFTLSQAGMVVHWSREKGRGWKMKSFVNGLGAVATFVVLLTFIYEKVLLDIFENRGREFGWIVLVLIGILFLMFKKIKGHYSSLKRALSLEGYIPNTEVHANTILILVPRVNRGVIQAVDYGKGLSGDVRGVHICNEPEHATAVAETWEQWIKDVPLVILPSPYRSVVGPLLAYLDEVERERPDTNVTVVVPEVVTGKWWHSLLHANYGALIKLYLLNRRNVTVANVRYFAVDTLAKERGVTK